MHAGAVPAVTTNPVAPSVPDVRRQPVPSRPHVKQVKTRRTVSGPRVDVLASRERSPASGSTTGRGLWILVFAMLLFAITLFRLAYAGLGASPGQVLVARLALRVRSKGLSGSSTVVAKTRADGSPEEPPAIRYRD
jgi:hypothetical protein